MTARPVTTVQYRLLVNPALGTGAGNTVHVGLDVQYGDQPARLVFEGLPRRIEQIRAAIDSIPSLQQPVDSQDPMTARELRAAMASSEMTGFAPALIKGDEIFDREQPFDPAKFTIDWFARQLATLMLVELGIPRGQHLITDGSLENNLEYLLHAWHAWRAGRDTETIADELAPRLHSELSKHADFLKDEIAKVRDPIVQWPRDADRVPVLTRAAVVALDAGTEPDKVFDDLRRRMARQELPG